MIVDDSFNYHARLNTNYHSLSSTITNYHAVWTCSNSTWWFMIVLFRLTERMIVHNSFSVSGSNQGGVNAIWLQHCHRHVKNKKAIIWTNIRTTVTLKERKWEKRRNLKKKKTFNEKWSGSLIPRLWRPSKYPLLVYTKTVDSVKRARWLARQTPNILHYSPPSNSGKMASRFASVTSEEIIQNKLFVVHFISLF